ncbi:MAG: transcriptional regulator CarH [Pseudomonadota bacterium]|jgi:DNA-binding transcriptional MerR regulator
MTWRISTVADMVGVPRNTLIAWERRLGILAPGRTQSGYRLYSDDEVALLKALKAKIDAGLKVSEAWSLIQRDRDAVLSASSADPAALRGKILAALIGFDRSEADTYGSQVDALPIEEQLHAVYFPMLREVGEGWETGRFTIAQEHHVSGWCRERMLLLLHGLARGRADGREVVLATPAGEHHEFGLLGLAVRLGLRGFRVTWLGANLPTAELIQHVRRRPPYAVALSLVHPRPAEEVWAFAVSLRDQLPDAVGLAIGGPAVAGVRAVDGVALVTDDALPEMFYDD